MVAAPAEMARARPLPLIIATAVLDELQATCVVISRVVPSENVAVAVNCWVVPPGRLGLAGVIATEDRVAVLTVKVVLPVTVP